MSRPPVMIRNAAILIGTGLVTVAAIVGYPFVLTIANATPAFVWLGLAMVVAAAAVLFLIPQVKGWWQDKTASNLRSNLNGAVDQTIGSGDAVLDSKTQLDATVRDAHAANLVQLRFPPAGYTGKTKIRHGGTVSVTKPITAGMDLASAVDFAHTEDSDIRAACSLARDLVATEFPGTVPVLVNTFGGFHYEKGTTFARTFAFQGDVLSWPEAHLSMVHLLHEPNKRRPTTPAHNDVPPIGSEAASADAPPSGKEPRKNLYFPLPHPARSGSQDSQASNPKPRSLRLDYPVSHRQDLLVKGLTHWAHGLVSMARVNAAGDIARVDAKLRKAVSVAEVASQWGLTLGAGIETKRIPRDAGCGWFGSYSDDVFTVPSRAGLTPLIQRLKLQGVRTLEGYDFIPGDRDEKGRGRRVVLFAYGAPELVRELPEVVRKALVVEPGDFFPVAAGVPECRGAHFVLFIEASGEELSEGQDAAFPGLTEHPLWASYVDAVDQWNHVKGDQTDMVVKEAD